MPISTIWSQTRTRIFGVVFMRPPLGPDAVQACRVGVDAAPTASSHAECSETSCGIALTVGSVCFKSGMRVGDRARGPLRPHSRRRAQSAVCGRAGAGRRPSAARRSRDVPGCRRCRKNADGLSDLRPPLSDGGLWQSGGRGDCPGLGREWHRSTRSTWSQGGMLEVPHALFSKHGTCHPNRCRGGILCHGLSASKPDC